MTAASVRVVPQYAPTEVGLNRLAGVMKMELVLTARQSNLPLLVVGLLSFCQLLMPPVDAPYAVLTVNNLKPVMSPEAMIVAAGTVFATLAFPFYVFFLGGARSRDAALGIAPLYLSSPVSTPLRAVGVAAGRILASVLLALGSTLAVLALLIVSVAVRTGRWPAGGTSIMAYFGVVAPVVLASGVAAAVVDAAVAGNGLKSMAVFSLWIALLVLSMFTEKGDFFGLRFLGQNIFPGQPAPSLAVGFISGNVGTVPWNAVRESAAHLLERFELVAMVAATAVFASFGMAATFRSRYAPEMRSREITAPQKSVSAQCVALCLPPQATQRPVVLPRALFTVARYRLSHRTLAKFLMIIAAALALASRDTVSVAAALALLVPVTLFGHAERRSAAIGRVLRFCTPSLWKPTPHLLEAFALCAIVAVPMSPAVFRVPGGGVWFVHFATGALAASSWMVLTHSVLGKELLGVSVYLLVWYLVACNRLPAGLDILAVHGTSMVSFGLTLTLAGLSSVAIARADHKR